MSGEVVEVNGTRLYCEVVGADDAPAVVFVHGFSLDTRMWDGQVSAFSERYRVVRYDLRGFGRSANPDVGVHYQHQDDLLGVLDHFRIEQAAIVGLSFGGGVAVDFALQQSDRVGALVLVDAVLAGLDMPELSAMSRPIWKAGRTSGVEVARALLLASPLFDVANERPVSREAVRTIVGDYSGWDFTESDPATWAEPNGAAQLERITTPTLVVVGERDIHDMQQVAEVLANGIPGARKVVLPGLGHLPNMEDADAFNDVALGFLGDVSSYGRRG